MSFDVAGARRAGYSDADIANYLAQQTGFDTAAARQAGYSDGEILAHLTTPAAPREPALTPATRPNTILDRIATGAGDPFRGLEQMVSRVQAGSDGGVIGRALRRNPNVAAVMERGNAAFPMPTPQEVDARVQAREEAYQAGRAAAGDTGTDWWRIGGQVASTLPLAAAMPAGSGLAGAAAAGAGQGAVLGALQPVTSGDFTDEKKQQVETGALLGAITGPVGYAVGRAIAPRVAPEVRQLADAGVQMTPGQMTGGVVRRFEDAVSSVPFIGESVRQAQRNSVESLNVAVANRALAPLGQRVPADIAAGQDLTAYVGNAISRAYEDALAAAGPSRIDAQFVADLGRVSNQFLTQPARTEFLQTVRQNVLSRLAGGQVDPLTYQAIRSDLGAFARDAAGPTASRSERELSKAFSSLQEAFDDLFKRANPTQAPLVDAANQAWAVLSRMETAGAARGARDGVFTPGMLDTAVRQADRSVRRRDFARGDALLQDLSGPAASVLPRAVPDSGTPERLAAMGVLGGAGLQSVFGFSNPALAALAGAYAAYTPPAQRAIQNAIMAQRSAPLRATGEAIARSGGAVSVPLGSLLLAPPSP